MQWVETIQRFSFPIFLAFLPWHAHVLLTQKQIVGENFSFAEVTLWATEIFLLLIFLLYGARLRLGDRRKLFFWGTIIPMWCVLSALWSAEPILAFEQAWHLGFALLMFGLLLDKRTDVGLCAVGFSLGLIAPTLLGIWQFVFGASGASTWLGLPARDAHVLGQAVLTLQDGARVLRGYGSFAHPNIFGGYAAIGLLALVGFRDRFLSFRYVKKLWWGLAILLSVALGLTFSQSAWIGFVFAMMMGAGMVFFGFSKTRGFARISFKSMQYMSAIATFVLLISTIAGVYFLTRVGVESPSVVERSVQYEQWVPAMSGNWILGAGAGNGVYAIEMVIPDLQWWQYQPVHHVLLHAWLEVGVVGLIFLVLWIAFLDARALKQLKNSVSIGKVPVHALVALMMGGCLLVIVGLDHYAWTQWQGLALCSFVLGLTARA